jgi:hypothetical protein
VAIALANATFAARDRTLWGLRRGNAPELPDSRAALFCGRSAPDPRVGGTVPSTRVVI